MLARAHGVRVRLEEGAAGQRTRPNILRLQHQNDVGKIVDVGAIVQRLPPGGQGDDGPAGSRVAQLLRRGDDLVAHRFILRPGRDTAGAVLPLHVHLHPADVEVDGHKESLGVGPIERLFLAAGLAGGFLHSVLGRLG